MWTSGLNIFLQLGKGSWVIPSSYIVRNSFKQLSNMDSNCLQQCSNFLTVILREKCPNTEFFLVRIFLYSVRMQENTDQKKLRIWTLFTQWKVPILYFLLPSMLDMFLYADNAKPFANIPTQITKRKCWKFHISPFLISKYLICALKRVGSKISKSLLKNILVYI